MPRGVYDRSKMKAKRSETKEPVAVKATKRRYKKFEKQVAAPEPEVGGSEQVKMASSTYEALYGGDGITALRSQLGALTAAWEKIAGVQTHQNNPALLAAIDGEIIATVGSMRQWRENTFSPTAKVAPAAAPKAAKAEAAPKVSIPTSPPAPAPIPPQMTGSPAPLPFTPQAVQEVLKQAGGN